MKNHFSILLLSLLALSCESNYYYIHDAHIFHRREPLYFIGSNGIHSGFDIVRIELDEIAGLGAREAIVTVDAQDSSIIGRIIKYSKDKRIIAWEIENGKDKVGTVISSIREADPHHIIGVVMDDVIAPDTDDYLNKVYDCVLVSDMDYLCFHLDNLSRYQDQMSIIEKMQRPCVFLIDDCSTSSTAFSNLLTSARAGNMITGCIVNDTASFSDAIRELDTCCTRYVALTEKILDESGRDFQIEVCFRNHNPQEDVRLVVLSDTTLLKENRDTVCQITKKFKAGTGKFKLGKLPSGFYQVNIDGIKPFNIGIRPEQISSPQDKPADFDEFWFETLSELSQVPLDVSMKLIPEYSNQLRNTYEVTFKSFGGATIGGILTEPVKDGKYPVVIEYMGYGATPYYRHPSANPERLEFMVSVREQGIFKEGHGKWVCQGIESKETFYYRGAYCDVVRALDYVCSLSKADTDRIYIWGESQGGAFTWIAASLDHRAKAIAPSVPFMGDFPDYGKIVKWPINQIMAAADSAGVSYDRVYDMLRYFDVKNFADRVTCPVYMAFGLQDVTCPPHTNFATYNIVSAPKQYMCIPQTGHSVWAQREWVAAKEQFFFKSVTE